MTSKSRSRDEVAGEHFETRAAASVFDETGDLAEMPAGSTQGPASALRVATILL
jgi:hypothetical protein